MAARTRIAVHPQREACHRDSRVVSRAQWGQRTPGTGQWGRKAWLVGMMSWGGAMGRVLVLLLLLTSTARAVDRDAARAHFQSAVELYDRGQYEPALLEFQKAQAL